jgi:mannose-6-phosphate isomerase-like protein (cupin superfamily)
MLPQKHHIPLLNPLYKPAILTDHAIQGIARSVPVTDNWKVIDLNEIRKGLGNKGVEYREFLRVPTLSCGLYRLEKGSKDMQTPHDEDEMYYVLEGRARLKVGDEEREISAGTALFVEAAETHSFFEIEEDMTLLVFFASSRPE